jgi:proteic killer suppression protein
MHKGLEDFFYDGTLKGIQAKHASKLEAILDRLDSANEIKDMNYPGSGLHLLLPKTKGLWAVKVSTNWRLTFEFQDGDALNPSSWFLSKKRVVFAVSENVYLIILAC